VNIKRQIISIILFLLVLCLLAVPTIHGFTSYILKAAIIGLLTAVLLKYSQDISNTDESSSSEDENEFSWLTLSDSQVSDAVKKRYENLLNYIIEAVKSINSDYEAAIYMQDIKSGGYTIQKSSGTDFKDFLALENNLINNVIKGKKLLINQHSDYKTDWDNIFNLKTWRGSETLISVPIFFKNKNRGFILVLSDHFTKIDKKDKYILSSLTNFISLGMGDFEILENLRLDNYFQSRLTNLFDSLEDKSSEKELFESVKGLCRTFFKYDKMTLSMLEDNGKSAQVKLVDGMQEDIPENYVFNLNGSIHGLSAIQSESILANNWRKEYHDLYRFDAKNDEAYNFSSLISCPISTNNIIQGILTLERLKSIVFTKSDQHFLEILANTAGSILAWQKEYRLVHQNSINDGLTGLLNHKALMERINEELNRAKRFNQTMTCLLLDLDKFKDVNDTHGHLFGDYVLKNVADILKDSVRTIDVVGRYGGEEFLILLINTDVEHSLPVAERIIQNIASFNFSYNGVNIHNTISGGMAGYPEDAEDAQNLINNSDMAMYRSKANGRNQVTIYK